MKHPNIREDVKFCGICKFLHLTSVKVTNCNVNLTGQCLSQLKKESYKLTEECLLFTLNWV